MTGALPPGAVIGILGGGQLGRMLAQAAQSLGYQAQVYCPDPASPAFQVTDRRSCADYGDEAALAAFAEAVSVVTYEFENVPAATADFLAARIPARPDPSILAVAQNRLKEKRLARELGLGTAAFAAVADLAGLSAAVEEVGLPAILKTCELGYDGKGQARLKAADAAALAAAWEAIGAPAATEAPAILERQVDFACEVSVIVARDLDGRMVSFPAAENSHRDGILHISRVPARVTPEVGAAAREAAKRLAVALGLEGLLAVEMFVTRDGEILINEMAPRPHNSGHWSLDAAATSQFEQHIRAIAGLPLGDPSPLCPSEMTNLIGDEALDAQAWLKDPRAKLHLYGKAEARPGRKMGHVTVLEG